jgi:hypothetical protein
MYRQDAVSPEEEEKLFFLLSGEVRERLLGEDVDVHQSFVQPRAFLR